MQVDLERLLPHRGPARFVQQVLHRDAQRAECVAVVPRTSAYAAGGSAAALLVVELAAQAAGVHHGLSGHGGSPGGRLVGLKSLHLATGQLACDLETRLFVTLEDLRLPLATYRFQASAGGTELASGVLTLWIGEVALG